MVRADGEDGLGAALQLEGVVDGEMGLGGGVDEGPEVVAAELALEDVKGCGVEGGVRGVGDAMEVDVVAWGEEEAFEGGGIGMRCFDKLSNRLFGCFDRLSNRRGASKRGGRFLSLSKDSSRGGGVFYSFSPTLLRINNFLRNNILRINIFLRISNFLRIDVVDVGHGLVGDQEAFAIDSDDDVLEGFELLKGALEDGTLLGGDTDLTGLREGGETQKEEKEEK